MSPNEFLDFPKYQIYGDRDRSQNAQFHVSQFQIPLIYNQFQVLFKIIITSKYHHKALKTSTRYY